MALKEGDTTCQREQCEEAALLVKVVFPVASVGLILLLWPFCLQLSLFPCQKQFNSGHLLLSCLTCNIDVSYSRVFHTLYPYTSPCPSRSSQKHHSLISAGSRMWQMEPKFVTNRPLSKPSENIQTNNCFLKIFIYHQTKTF